MGAVQRLATVVIVGLVALSTILVLYLADESNRIKAEEEEQQEAAVERGTANYISLCMSCHGPAGKGYTEPSEAGTGRVGAPISSNYYKTGVNASGTPFPGGYEAFQEQHIRSVIHNGLPGSKPGTYRMPPWGEENDGPLNDSQIDELVVFIEHADWNHVYNEAIAYAGGYPTAPAAAATEAPAEPTAAPAAGSFNVAMEDIKFDVTELTIPANQDVTINLVNNGAAAHNFTITGTEFASGDYMAGQTGTLVVNLPPGEYEFDCTIPGHKEAGMVGKLIVSEDAAAAAPAEDTAPAAETPATGGDAPAAATAVDVAMQDIAFDKKEITIPANTDITFNLVNSGAATHNFTIIGTDFASGDYAGGQTGTLVVNLPPGEYEYDCTIPGHKEAGMVGKLIVQ